MANTKTYEKVDDTKGKIIEHVPTEKTLSELEFELNVCRESITRQQAIEAGLLADIQGLKDAGVKEEGK